VNEVLKAIRERRSYRAFKPDMPPQEVIDQIIEAGLYAPNGMGSQSPIIIELTNTLVPGNIK
jgi:nitroreductase